MENKLLSRGDKAPDFIYKTPYNQVHHLSEKIKEADKTFLIFLRYYGSPVCQADIRELRENAARFTAGKAQLLLVVQSHPAVIAHSIDEKELELEIACDPEMELYRTYQVACAKNKAGLLSLRTLRKVYQARKLGITRGISEGDELQLPAVFLMDRNMDILYACRGRSAGDLPTVKDLLDQL